MEMNTALHRSWRVRMHALIAVISGLVLGAAAGPGAVANAQASPDQDGPRISLVAFPDVAGEGDFWPSCAGCDGEFTAADALIASADPLPALEVRIRDDAGMTQTMTTSALSQGRQAAGFMVPTAGNYTVEIVALPPDWALCPSASMSVSITAADFDPSTELARVDFPFTRGCDTLATETPTLVPSTATLTPGGPTSTPFVPTATATPIFRATVTPGGPTVTPEPSPTATRNDDDDDDNRGSGSSGGGGSSSGAGAHGSIRGLVFIDLNGDGALGPDEPGVAGVRVRLDGGGEGFHVITSGAGSYEFGGLAVGSYNVSIEAPAGYSLTTTGRYEGVFVNNQTILGIDFGLSHGDRAATRSVERVTTLPSTGVLTGGPGGLLIVLSLLTALLGALGLALERRRASNGA